MGYWYLRGGRECSVLLVVKGWKIVQRVIGSQGVEDSAACYW